MKEEQFRLTKSLLAVQFCTGAETLLLRLPVGANVGILGSSVIPGCLEIDCKDQHYHIFKEDLLRYSTGRRALMAARA